MNFQSALAAIKDGRSASRGVWATNNRTPMSLYKPADTAGLFLRSATYLLEVPWTPTVEDLLAEDWAVDPT